MLLGSSKCYIDNNPSHIVLLLGCRSRFRWRFEPSADTQYCWWGGKEWRVRCQEPWPPVNTTIGECPRSRWFRRSANIQAHFFTRTVGAETNDGCQSHRNHRAARLWWWDWTPSQARWLRYDTQYGLLYQLVHLTELIAVLFQSFWNLLYHNRSPFVPIFSI